VRLYDPDKDELKLLYWWLHLRSDPVEFENLFAEPLRGLTAILNWAKNSVNIMFNSDEQGITFAAWVEPFLSGAYFGAWSRKDVRGSKGHLRFMDECFTRALEQYPVLVGVTKQERLHNIHLKMGYRYLGEIGALFDGSPARVYTMNAESRANRAQARQEINHGRRRIGNDINGNGKQPLRASHRKVRESVPASGEDIRTTTGRSPKNRRRQRKHPDHQSGSGRIEGSGIVGESGDAASVGESGTG
jgi:hypothetical protein